VGWTSVVAGRAGGRQDRATNPPTRPRSTSEAIRVRITINYRTFRAAALSWPWQVELTPTVGAA
jgi:hypothetical protein